MDEAKGRDYKLMSIKEFREMGFLQAINRELLHPCGLALAVTISEDGTETLGPVYDDREDSVGFWYESVDRDKASRFSEEWNKRIMERIKVLGFSVQPINKKEGNEIE